VIAHLSGTLLEKHVQRLVIDVGGVGYDVHVPLSTFYSAGEPGGSVSLRIHTHVREDALLLYGFATALEITLFQRLINVNGIGPKLALAILSGVEPETLVRSIREADVARLTRIPGVGRKTADRLVLELKDRLPAEILPAEGGGDVRADVLSALVNLGYQRSAVEPPVDRVLKRQAGLDFEAVLREVLKEMAR